MTTWPPLPRIRVRLTIDLGGQDKPEPEPEPEPEQQGEPYRESVLDAMVERRDDADTSGGPLDGRRTFGFGHAAPPGD